MITLTTIVGLMILGFGIASGKAFAAAAGVAMPGGGGGGGRDPRGGHGGGDGGRWKNWVALVCYLIGGIGGAVALVPLFLWLLSWGSANTSGILAAIMSIVVVAVGWYALDGAIAVVKDLADGVPDKEAHTAAVLVPTAWPVGFASFWALLTNPGSWQAQGIAAIVLSGIGIFFVRRIIKKTKPIKTAPMFWHWATTILCLMVGIMHIPSFMIANEFLDQITFGIQLGSVVNIPAGELPTAIRVALFLTAVMLTFAMVGDNVTGNKRPDLPTFTWAHIAVPTFAVVGMSGFGITMTTLAMASAG